MIVFKAHSKPVYDLVFSADGQQLLTSGGDENVVLWSLETLTSVRKWPGSKFWAPVAFSLDGRFVGRGGYGVHVWPVDGTTPLVSSSQFSESVAFAPNSKEFVAHGSSSTGMTRWALPSAKSLPGGWGGTRESNAGNQFPTGAVAYSPDGALLAACFGVSGKRGFDSVIYLWAVKSGKLRGALRADFAVAHPTAIRFSPDSQLLAGIYGPTLRIWDITAEKEIVSRTAGKKHFKGLAFSPNGRRLVAASNDTTIRFWDAPTWSEQGGFEWEIGKLGAVVCDATGCRMAAGSSSGKIVIWDVDR